MNLKNAETCFHENKLQRGAGVKPFSSCSSGKVSGLKTRGILLLLFVLVPAVLVASATALGPVPNFSANITTGAAPLTVNFTDLSVTTPTAWAWYFGDENFTNAWGPANFATWSVRESHSTIVTPNGSIVLMGGSATGGSVPTNDTWLSPDNGITWTQTNASSGWIARGFMASVMMPDRSIVLMGGQNGTTMMNDTWRSTNNGTSWTIMNASSGWSARYALTSVSLSDGSIVLMGGANSTGNLAKNDTWRSTDNGGNWTLMNASSGWSQRYGQTSVALPDDSIVLMGGVLTGATTYRNDTWRSTDKGGNWTLMNASSGWPARLSPTSVSMPDGSIVLMGGLNSDGLTALNDAWRSTDMGATWTRLNASVSWSPRSAMSSNVLPDGSIVLIGGNDPNAGPTNDVYRLLTAGSTGRNPTHVYNANGLYQVALQVTNASGYNSTRVAGFINVTSATAAQTGANFTATPTSGTAPLTVVFADLSTNGPTAWNWSFGDGNVTNSTVQNPIHTYVAPGSYTVALNASNSTGFNITTKVAFITVAAAINPNSTRVGIYKDGNWYLDFNGNGTWDGAAVDKNYNFGGPLFVPVMGDWNGNGTTKIGVTNNIDWFLDTDGDGVLNTTFDKQCFFGIPGYSPIVGKWAGNNTTRIGVTNGVDWYLDLNGDGTWNGTSIDQHCFFGLPGFSPIVGDWTGNGTTRIGVTNGVDWYLDINGNGVWDGATIDEHGFFGIPGYTPVVGQWTGNSTTKIGVTNGVDWYLDTNGNGVWDGTSVDQHGFFGLPGYTPIVGDWTGNGVSKIGVTNDVNWYLDSNGNGVWDGPVLDSAPFFGISGWTPVTGKWA